MVEFQVPGHVVCLTGSKELWVNEAELSCFFSYHYSPTFLPLHLLSS